MRQVLRPRRCLLQPGLTGPRVVIFARAPVAGQVKTRLAAAIGADAALEFYRATLHQIAGRLASDTRWSLVLAVTPDAATDDVALWPPAPRIAQGSGDLGDRMGRLLAQATPDGPVVIVGSDIPALDAGHVGTALDALAGADLVIGPARDGGYWLIGSRRPIPAALFQGVRWSTAHACADTLCNADGLAVAMADELEDVDEPEDYRRFRDGTRL